VVISRKAINTPIFNNAAVKANVHALLQTDIAKTTG